MNDKILGVFDAWKRSATPGFRGLADKLIALAAGCGASLSVIASAHATVIFQSTNDFGTLVNYAYCSGCLTGNNVVYSAFNITQSTSIGSIKFAISDIKNEWTPLTTSITTTIYSVVDGYAGGALYQQTVNLADFASKVQSQASPPYYYPGGLPIITYGENTPGLSLGAGSYFISFVGTYLGVPTFAPTLSEPLTYQTVLGGVSPYHNRETLGFVLDGESIPSTPVVPAVPEPSTWAMMLMGFSALGFAAYRNRRATSALA